MLANVYMYDLFCAKIIFCFTSPLMPSLCSQWICVTYLSCYVFFFFLLFVSCCLTVDLLIDTAAMAGIKLVICFRENIKEWY